jgi:hypothetical protein
MNSHVFHLKYESKFLIKFYSSENKYLILNVYRKIEFDHSL